MSLNTDALKNRRDELLASEVNTDPYTGGFFMGLTEAIKILDGLEGSPEVPGFVGTLESLRDLST